MNKKVLVIVQARLGSTRFPNKVLKKIGKKTVIEMIVDRIAKSIIGHQNALLFLQAVINFSYSPISKRLVLGGTKNIQNTNIEHGVVN